jgi:hypothetical protein
MCPHCEGLGVEKTFRLEGLLDVEKSINEGALDAITPFETQTWGNIYTNLARIYRFNLATPFKDLSEKFQQIIITVTPTVFFSDVFKKNGLGIIEMTFVLLMVTGGVVFSNNKIPKPLGWMSGWGAPATDKPYMYWDKDRYMATDSSSIHSRAEVLPMHSYAFINMKKIMRPDTLTVDNAMGKVWYDKSNNHVEFFTSFGKHPENEKTLKQVSEHILEIYAGENAILEE